MRFHYFQHWIVFNLKGMGLILSLWLTGGTKILKRTKLLNAWFLWTNENSTQNELQPKTTTIPNERMRIFHNLISTERNCVTRTVRWKKYTRIDISAHKRDRKRINCRKIHIQCVKSEIYGFLLKEIGNFPQICDIKAIFAFFLCSFLHFLVNCYFCGQIKPSKRIRRVGKFTYFVKPAWISKLMGIEKCEWNPFDIPIQSN